MFWYFECDRVLLKVGIFLLHCIRPYNCIHPLEHGMRKRQICDKLQWRSSHLWKLLRPHFEFLSSCDKALVRLRRGHINKIVWQVHLIYDSVGHHSATYHFSKCGCCSLELTILHCDRSGCCFGLGTSNALPSININAYYLSFIISEISRLEVVCPRIRRRGVPTGAVQLFCLENDIPHYEINSKRQWKDF